MNTTSNRPRKPRKARELLLNKGAVALVDAEDYERLACYTWHVTESGYARRSDRVNGNTYMHREIMGFPPSNLHVDHINGNRLDNRRSNLRLVSATENQHNRRKHKVGHSARKGVTRAGKKWSARIRIRGVNHYLGTYDTEEQAAATYDLHATMLLGEYACPNYAFGPEATRPAQPGRKRRKVSPPLPVHPLFDPSEL